MEIPVLVIALFDLENTTDELKVKAAERLLELAYNRKAVMVPLHMEPTGEVYFRDKNLHTNAGRVYTGTTDDKRAIKEFTFSCFHWVKSVLPGREKIIIYHSSKYVEEAQMLERLVVGLKFQSQTIRTENTDFIAEIQ